MSVDVEACIWCHLVLNVLVTELQLHNVLKRSEQRLIEVEMRRLRPARQNLRQNVVEEGDGLLGYVALFVTRRLLNRETLLGIASQQSNGVTSGGWRASPRPGVAPPRSRPSSCGAEVESYS